MKKFIPFFRFSSFPTSSPAPDSQHSLITSSFLPIKPKNSIVNKLDNLVMAQFLPLAMNEKDLKKYFDPKDENLISIRLIKDRMGKYRGKALFEFKNSEICDKYIKKHHEEFLQTEEVMQKIVFKSFRLKVNTEKTDFSPKLRNVFLSNIGYNLTSDDLFAIAIDFGDIKKIQVPTVNGRNKGVAFIDFEKAESAVKFKGFMDGREWGGRKIRAQSQDVSFDTQKKRTAFKSDLVLER